MFNLFSNQSTCVNRLVTSLVILLLVIPVGPSQLVAEAATTTPPTADVSGCMDATANNYDDAATADDGSCTYDPVPVAGCTDAAANNYDETATDDDGSCTYDDVPGTTTGSSTFDTAATTTNLTATSTAPSATTTPETATSTETAGGETNPLDGADGANTENASSSASSTPPTDDGEGSGGSSGEEGGDGEGSDPGAGVASTTPGHDSEPIPFLTDGLIGDTDSPEGEDVTGGVRERARTNVTITTGDATAQGQVVTDANATNLRSLADAETRRDLDHYTFEATGTNDAIVENDVAALSVTGENRAIAGGEAAIVTGDAVSVFNIANVINSNIVNSDGYLYLANQIMTDNTSLNLQDFFFPGGESALAGAADCSLNSCLAEDIEYNFSQFNHATITNDAYIEANTGDNYVYADRADIVTGNAYGAANVVNVVNTNIVDSNYRLLTFNAVGTLDGDLILPTAELFDAFFGLPNGLNQLQVGEDEDGLLEVDNQNDVQITNNLDTYAESGLNEITAIDSDITTGRSESDSNVLNKVNDNVFGGDLMYLWIRIHGGWSGDVVGLPDGLAWEWSPDGIIIYNADAEVTPSEFLGYDVDAYTARVINHNSVVLDNNIHIDAISGRNEVDDGLIGSITTGETYASANVMNIANSNIIAANWTMAIVNIMGDFDGNVTFAQTDLTLQGEVVANTDPIGPGTLLTFEYTVANSSDQVASEVMLSHALTGARVGTARYDSVAVGDLAPGETRQVTLQAEVDTTATTATTSVTAVASVDSAEGDLNPEDNTVQFDLLATYTSDTDTTGTTTSTTTTDTGDTDTGDESGDTTNNDDSVNDSSNNSGSSPSSGGGGPRKKSSAVSTVVERTQTDVDPNSPPELSITKAATNASGSIPAGQDVNYIITVTNDGGYAYDAVVDDVLENPIGARLTSDSWDLGTILPGEQIVLEYTTNYDVNTPSGTYTNTASLTAYAKPAANRTATTASLTVADAVHLIEIDGVALAVGNVALLAYYPTGNGQMGAVFVWETSKPAQGQIHYGPGTTSPFNPSRRNYGYRSASLQLPGLTTSHAMIVNNLRPNTNYAYHISATDGDAQGFGGPYFFTTPRLVNRLTLAGITSRVAGAAISTPSASVTSVSSVTTPTPATAPTTPSPAVATNPAPTPPPTPTPPPAPEPTPEPVTTPEPEPQETGFFSKVKEEVTGWFW